MAGETLSLTVAQSLFTDHHQSELPIPGSWFFETGLDTCSGSTTSAGSTASGNGGELSPCLHDIGADEFQFGLIRANGRSVTETVEVPSSEHVAEIVGRQGCKIKSLRQKTNTYIKTPIRGEEPVFVVTGRAEDVEAAKREIECAAEHFTQIRASRRHSQGGAPAPGHVTAYVRVPLRVVGLVVGPKGATIKRIQQDTHTYIITPSREREPIFEVTGLPQNVDAARREIEQHIYQRTGNMPITDPNASIQTFDFQSAASAACRSAAGVPHGAANRPNYGALAAGTHELRKASALEQMAAASKAAQDAAGAGDTAAYADATAAYAAAYKRLQQSVHAQAAAASQLGVALPPAPQLPAVCPLAGQFADADDLHDRDQLAGSRARLDSLASFPLNPNNSAPNSTRGSSPAPVGAQTGSNPYHTWSNAYSHEAVDGTEPSMTDLFTLFSQSCGLNSQSSGSRDEGLGDSPTNSISRLNQDPYHLIMSSIWSDLDSHQQQQHQASGNPALEAVPSVATA